MKQNTNLSYVHGAASGEPLLYQTIGDALDHASERWSDKDALVSVHQSIRLSFKQLKDKADNIAAAFIKLGFKPGDRVGIWAPNCAEWTIVQFATAKAGIILVNINPAYRLSELEYAVNKVSCRGLVIAESFKSSNYIEMLQTLAPELQTCEPGSLQSKKLPHLDTVIHLGDNDIDGFYKFKDLDKLADDASRQKQQQLQRELQADDPINIQFTSGTTGSPKGATLTHFNILNNGYNVGAKIKLGVEDRLCIPVPLYHCFGMVMGNLACVTRGAAMVYPSDAFAPNTVLEAIQKEKCTALYGVPTMFVAILSEPDFSSYDVSTLRTGIMAGALCPVEIMKRVIQEMHMDEVTICYGMTETSPVSFQSDTDDPFEKRVTSVGRIHPNLEVKIVDENNKAVAIGQQGELCTRGYSVMLGYWADEEKTKEVIDSAGWMHTGDLARIDEEGYCYITGRLKDMVIRGGENIYPKEIEEFLYKHPAVEEVQIFGVPDQKYGEELCAWVQLKGDRELSEEELKAHCKGNIAHYKIPRYVRFVTEYPMTVTGKIQKFIMREQMTKELGLN